MINREDDELKLMLRHYIPSKWHDLNDWDIIILRQKEISDNLNLIRCSFIDLYFDDNGIPLTYDKVHIINKKVYYDFNSDDSCSGTYTYLGDIYNYD